ncbi:MAG TPA: SDR family oxidoreductase [Dongiaceae bacterium]|nr:SDR family oxidoreductase [Dongiaceae bacterium]
MASNTSIADSPKRAFITGAASGLGRELALRFARAGYRVCVADIHEERALAVVAELKALGPDAFFYRCDVSQDANLQNAPAAMQERWGGTDLLINNAGVAGGGPFDWLSLDDWHWMMNINFNGVLRGCHAFVPAMKEQGHGHIVNIASMAGLLNPPGMSNYNVAKAAVVSLSETLAPELHPFGIGVTCVCPSFFRTNLGESLRSPDLSTQQTLNKLVDNSSDLTAADIADRIFIAAERNQFLVIPHEKAVAAWQRKCADLDDHLQAQHVLAENLKQRARRSD